ncbi:hypothetical protein BASA81_009090 [Batrachochytrium salamandrivorans]|nr:hypothetical protein BASA81_009090 [Batrachochytrium salamandrivorans]
MGLLRLADYEVQKQIGQGRFSTVFKAKRNGLTCALKKLAVDSTEKARVARELDLLLVLHLGDNVIKHRGYFFSEDGSLYIELEWASRGDLGGLIKRHLEISARLSEETIWDLFAQITRGLYHLHHEASMAHRDLNPANILIMQDLTLRVGDLGLLPGTGVRQYMAPDLLLSGNNDGGVYWFALDVWSLGCILYELVCLVSPFKDYKEGENRNWAFAPIPEKPRYSTDLRQLVSDLLQVDPRNRPTTLQVLQRAENGTKMFPRKLSVATSTTAAAATTAATSELITPISPSNLSILSTGSEVNSPSPSARYRPPSLQIPQTAPVPTSTRMSPNTAPVLTTLRSPPFSKHLRSETHYSTRLQSPKSAGVRGTFSPVPPAASLPRTLNSTTLNGTMGDKASLIPQSPRIGRFVKVNSSTSNGVAAMTTPSPVRPIVLPTPPPHPPPVLVSPKSAQLLRSGFEYPGKSFPKRHTRHNSTSALPAVVVGVASAGLRVQTMDFSPLSSSDAFTDETNSANSQPRNEGARLRADIRGLSVSTGVVTSTTPHNPFATTAIAALPTPREEKPFSFHKPLTKSPRSTYKFQLWSKVTKAVVPVSPNVPTVEASKPPPPPPVVNDGDQLTYILGNVVGEGSFAKVYHGVDIASGMSIAVKQFILREDEDGDTTQSIRHAQEMEGEIAILKAHSHPNLVRYMGTKRETSKLSIILEFCTMGSIAKMLQEFTKFPERLIRIYTKQMNEGLRYLHSKNVVHRDIKGSNVLVSQNRDECIVKLSDFGCSKRINKSAVMSDKTIAANKRLTGTVLWMAPEAARSDPNCGFASDVWSMGATVIEMATGKTPWAEEKFDQELVALFKIGTTTMPPQFPSSLSPIAHSFLRACMDVDPTKRHSTGRLVFHDFLRINDADGEPTSAAVKTALPGALSEMVGANALRAAGKGRERLEQRREAALLQGIKLRVKVMEALCGGDSNSLDMSWQQQCFERDVEVTLPRTSDKRLAGLPVFLDGEGDGEANRVVVGRDEFAAQFSSSVTSQFHPTSVRSFQEMIQVDSLVAMWKWEIHGEFAGKPLRVGGSASCTFTANMLKIKTLELQWDPNTVLVKM